MINRKLSFNSRIYSSSAGMSVRSQGCQYKNGIPRYDNAYTLILDGLPIPLLSAPSWKKINSAFYLLADGF
jgi:hypothetical protein